MGNSRESIHFLTLKQDIDLHQVSLFLTIELPVQGCISASTGLELIEEIKDDLGQRQAVPHLNAILR